MNREPWIFAIFGVLFGFVLGYMVAGSRHDAAVPARVAAMPPGLPNAPAPAAVGAAPAPTESPKLDPAEVRALTSLAEKEAQNLSVRVELGNLLMDHGQEAEAARWYREALAIDPTQTDVRVDLGACLVRAGQYTEALAAFDEALKRNPGHKKALFNKGVAFMQSGQPKLAVGVWDDLLKRYPDDPQLKDLREQIQRVRSGMGQS
jgi:tetratricopeptide (TPR) repeat protein